MGRAVMVGRGPTGTGLFFLSTLIILLTARSSRAQKVGACRLWVTLVRTLTTLCVSGRSACRRARGSTSASLTWT
ncbi:unnamed protein product [Coregonus sp. 'balchen']|nr:unnamed protein product [Coregonus sp. 'balchen']